MTSRSLGLALAGGALLLGGAVAWLWAARAPAGGLTGPRALAGSDLPAAPVAPVVAPARPELADATDARDAARGGLRAGRAPGVELEAPDALRALSGRVVDAATGEPLAGIELSFLSRRPKNVRATTDAAGAFTTERELASGVVAVSHVPDAAHPRYAGRHEFEPAEFLLPRADESAPPFPVLYSARAPRRVFEVHVRRPDGLPAGEANVALSSGRRDERGAFVADARDFEVADASGRARFALHGEEAFQDSYRLEAEQGAALVSEPREYDPPLPVEPERVDLYPGAVLRVIVKNDDGRLVPGVSLWLTTPEHGRFAAGRRGETDAAGEHVYTGLRATCWTIAAAHPWTGESVERAVDLAAGEYATVELRLSVQSLRLGAQGYVADEDGAPVGGVAVHVQAPGASPVQLATDAAGRFQYWGLPASTLLLGFGGGFLDDAFEPGVVSIPFGATGLVVRRSARAVVWLARPETASLAGTVSVLRTSAPSGVAALALPLGEEVRFAVDAPGYLRAEGDLAALFDEARDGAPLRVSLARGFQRSVEVRDRISRALLGDAAFYARDAVLGVTDGSGRATLRAADWPGVVRVECTGYAPLAWDPLAAGWPGTVVWLDPLRAR